MVKRMMYFILSVMLFVLLLSTQTISAEIVDIPYYYETTSEGEKVIVYEYNAKDALRVLRVLAKMETGHFNRAYDVNADGSITIEDAELALKSAARLVKVQFPMDYWFPE